jgi:predicted GNAT family N-acyltransferase
VWCNARTPAVGLYAREGFAIEGEEFELPEIGPHVVMTRSL